MCWEAAEGGTGVSERLIEEPDAIARIAKEALRVCHFNPDTGEDTTEHRCVVACYECLLSYSNQTQHRFLDRRVTRDFLLRLSSSTTAAVSGSRSREEQYQWLLNLTDPRSEFERRFLKYIYEKGCRLPDNAQNRPCSDIPTQPDFYYERQGIPGICIFIDGSAHDKGRRKERDKEVRSALENRGYRVIAIRFDEPLDEQINRNADVFGS